MNKQVLLFLVIVCCSTSISARAQFSYFDTIVEEGASTRSSEFEDLADGVRCVRREIPIITERWAFYPIVSGEKATRRDSGSWGRPHYLVNVVLAGIVKQDLSSGRATYCKIQVDSRTPYDRGDLFCFGNNTVYFKIKQLGEIVFCKWGESAEASKSNWHPSKEQMPFSVRHLTPVPIHQSDLPEQKDVAKKQGWKYRNLV